MLSVTLGSVHELGSSSSLHRVTVQRDQVFAPCDPEPCPHCRMPSSLFVFLCSKLLAAAGQPCRHLGGSWPCPVLPIYTGRFLRQREAQVTVQC